MALQFLVKGCQELADKGWLLCLAYRFEWDETKLKLAAGSAKINMSKLGKSHSRWIGQRGQQRQTVTRLKDGGSASFQFDISVYLDSCGCPPDS
jgi:hypothetical protein